MPYYRAVHIRQDAPCPWTPTLDAVSSLVARSRAMESLLSSVTIQYLGKGEKVPWLDKQLAPPCLAPYVLSWAATISLYHVLQVKQLRRAGDSDSGAPKHAAYDCQSGKKPALQGRGSCVFFFFASSAFWERFFLLTRRLNRH